MRALAWKMLREFGEKHPLAMEHLKRWWATAERADWSCFADVRRDYPSVDQVGDNLIFNIGANKFRLIVRIDYPSRVLWTRWIGTHAECDRIKNVEEL